MFVDKTHDFWHLGNGSGIYDGCSDTNPTSNHAVTLTGYRDDYWEIRNRFVIDSKIYFETKLKGI